VLPGILRWSLAEPKPGAPRDEAYALEDSGPLVLIDPLSVEGWPPERLGQISAIVLTAACHQRAAWRLRRERGLDVFAPDGARGFAEQPDLTYAGGDALPGGLTAFDAPGPTEASVALWLTRPRGLVYLADLLVHDGSGRPRFLPDDQLKDPRRTRLSVQRIHDQLEVEALLFAHGPPILEGGARALRECLGC
jgi:glyoxylase-like metal-dependent hydrolase (beta-lactamase superfamily II)